MNQLLRRCAGPWAPSGLPSRLLVSTLVAILVALLSAGSASATVWSAAADDPADDAELDGAAHTSPPIEFRRVTVEYDDQTGRVSGAYTFGPTPQSSQTVWAGIGLGVLQPDGSCNAPGFVPRRPGVIGGWEVGGSQGQAVVQGYWNDRSAGSGVRVALYSQAPATFWNDRPPSAYSWGGGPSQQFNFATVKPEFVGRGYNCARFASAARDDSGGSADHLNGDPVRLVPGAAPPPPGSGGGGGGGGGTAPGGGTPVPGGGAAPRTVITGGPVDGSRTRARTARFSFTADRTVAFRCRLYSESQAAPPFGECSAAESHTVRKLDPGTYVFEVMATDANGVAEQTPARRVFTVSKTGNAAVGGERTPFFLVSNWWERVGDRTRLVLLKLRGVPARTTAVVTCAGKECPFRRRAFAPSKKTVLKLQKPFGGRLLPAKTKIGVTFRMPGLGKHRTRFQTRANDWPVRRDFCPGPSGKFQRCG
jgi:hypothetical protein